MTVPTQRTPIQIARGVFNDLVASKSAFKEGELLWAQDQDKLYVTEMGPGNTIVFTAASTGAAAGSTPSGPINVGGAAPANPVQGTLWFDTTTSGNKGLKVYNNGAWANVVSADSMPPASAGAVGGVKIGAGMTVQPDGTISVPGVTIVDVLTSTSTTNALSANQGKVLKDLIDGLPKGTPAGGTAPTSPAAGALWVDTTTPTAPVLKTWNGTAWAPVGAPPAAASTTAAGLVQLADAAAVTAGTAGRVVDAAQLKAAAYTLPAASTTALGGVKAGGSHITIAADGTISANFPGGLVFKGVVDVTAVAPTGTPAAGDMWVASAAGAAHAGWAGLTTISKDALLIFDGTNWIEAGDLGGTSVAPVDASSTVKGIVQLADAAAITAGTAGRVVDAAQLKVVADAVPAAPVDATATTGGLLTDAMAVKLEGIAAGAEVNVQADWNEATASSDAFIKNKPTIPAAVTVEDLLTSTSTSNALSAAQGKALKDLLDAISPGATVGGTAPTTPTAGQLWMDTSTSTAPVLKVWDSAAWSPVGASPAAATATAVGLVQLADAAAVTAGTAGRVVDAAQLKVVADAVAAASAGGVAGITGTAPVTVDNTAPTQPVVSVADASTTAKGIVQLADAAAVTAGTTGRVVDAAQLKAVSDGAEKAIPSGGTAPTAPVSGDLWLDTTTAASPVLKRYDGSAWQTVGGSSVTVENLLTSTSTVNALSAAQGKALKDLIDGAPGATVSATAPSSPTAGALWVDTTTPATPKLKTWNGTAWAEVGATPAAASTTAAGLVQLADAAAVTAGTAGRVVDAAQLKAAVPTTTQGDLIVRGATADDRLAIGTKDQVLTVNAAGTDPEWKALPDASTTVKGVVQLADAAEVTAGTAGRVVDAAQLKDVIDLVVSIPASATAPTSPAAGDLWLDITTAATPALKRYDGAVWVSVGGGTTIAQGATAPTSPAPASGDLWIDTTDATKPILKRYEGTEWNAVDKDWQPYFDALVARGGSSSDLPFAEYDSTKTYGYGDMVIKDKEVYMAMGSSVAAGVEPQTPFIDPTNPWRLMSPNAVETLGYSSGSPDDYIQRPFDDGHLIVTTSSNGVGVFVRTSGKYVLVNATVSSAAPSEHPGVLWYDTSTPALKIWNGTAWVIASGSSVTIEDVLTSTSATNALSANQGKALKDLIDALLPGVYVGTTAPANPTEGVLWEDTTTTGAPELKHWDGAAWSAIGGLPDFSTLPALP